MLWGLYFLVLVLFPSPRILHSRPLRTWDSLYRKQRAFPGHLGSASKQKFEQFASIWLIYLTRPMELEFQGEQTYPISDHLRDFLC